MKSIAKKTVVLFAGLILFASYSMAEGVKWTEDFGAAKEQAAKEKKALLVLFTGSDWCGWCVKLNKEVFTKKEFIEYAEKNLVLFKADFPRGIEQTEAIKKQNKQLAEEYDIEGFPTVFLLDKDGKKLEKTGYRHGGPVAYVDFLKKAINKNVK